MMSPNLFLRALITTVIFAVSDLESATATALTIDFDRDIASKTVRKRLIADLHASSENILRQFKSLPRNVASEPQDFGSSEPGGVYS